MAPSFDYAASSLLCVEDNTTIFDEIDNNYNKFSYYNDDYFGINSSDINGGNKNFDHQDCNFLGLDLFVPISDEYLTSLSDKESQYFVGVDYLKRLRSGDLDIGARNLAIDWIFKVQSHYNFGPLCAYLAVNYLDRFLSTYELPKSKTWMMQLLAVACLSLAAKVDETDVPLSLDLQVGESKFIFEAKTIQRMELLVLSTLKWQMQSVTPFSFIEYFLYKLSGNERPPRSLIFQAIQLILSIIKGIDLLEFRPSEIAAAVVFSVTHETQLIEPNDKAFSFLNDHVQKERLMKCVEIMQDLRMNKSCIEASTSEPQSPIGVLDASCLSYKSDETSTPSGSCINSAHTSPAWTPTPAPAPKRRKLS